MHGCEHLDAHFLILVLEDGLSDSLSCLSRMLFLTFRTLSFAIAITTQIVCGPRWPKFGEVAYDPKYDKIDFKHLKTKVMHGTTSILHHRSSTVSNLHRRRSSSREEEDSRKSK